jgi:hypothetical protein
MAAGLIMLRRPLILALSLIAIIVVFLAPPIAQSPAYHLFADQQEIFGVPHFWNVISNLPLAIVGVLGVFAVRQIAMQKDIAQVARLYYLFFWGVFFCGIGSAYYHYAPSNATLVWDRLPMAVTFMTFFGIILNHYASPKFAGLFVLLLSLTGILSVLYWDFTETRGAGDLRFYALVQFLPLLLMPVIIFKRDSTVLRAKYIWLLILFYALAKIFESLDQQIYAISGVMSGHPIKHVFAAIGAYMVICSLKYNVARNKTGLSKEAGR